ncbi:MAG: UDP-N-acetylmuramoyl-tripeptide--D-alanyl-D-alanine ligase [bacterium]|nr:MAG: UDP-N-acetylmuramoyl-tripeptide--D-alanyl-D-alanine ligase [bacterium]
MMDLVIQELLNIQDCRIEFKGKPEILEQPVAGFSIDSRTIKPSQAFIAIKGEKYDGHQFIPEVQTSGVQIFVVSRFWFESQDQQNLFGNYFIVDDTLRTLQEIGRYYRLKFSIPLLALTGSNGKTTTKEMIAAVLGEKYNVIKNKGNLNNHIGVPLSLLEISTDHDIAVLEMGTNHFGEVARLAEIAHPTCGLITNIGPAHLEFFGSLQGVYKAKSELWRFLEQHGQIAFINIDDDLLSKNLPLIKKIVTYGFENTAHIQGKYLGLDEQGRSRFRVNGTEINLGIVGMHNIYNALAAVAVGLEFDLNMSQIKVALEKFLPTSKRMEVIRKKGLVIINDCYNSNPESARKSLLTLSQMQTQGKRIAVLADMLELGKWSESEHQRIGEYVFSLGNIDHLLTYGPLSTLTTRQAETLGLKNAMHFNDKKELIYYLSQITTENDLVLIKGSRGMVMEEVTRGILEG